MCVCDFWSGLDDPGLSGWDIIVSFLVQGRWVYVHEGVTRGWFVGAGFVKGFC